MRKDSKIYIAGHRGLVGSAILKNLSSKGYTNFILKTSEELDLRNQRDVEDFFQAYKPEFVFLAAAKVGGIVANNVFRGEFLYDNIMIQSNVIESARKHKASKLLFLGSTCIYPRDCPQPMKEEYLLTGPLEQTNEPYAISKIAGLKMCENYNRQYRTNFISVMPTNLYGPNDNFDLEKSHVLPALIRKIHLGKALHDGHWDVIRNDLNVRPIESVDGHAEISEIRSIFKKYGIFKDIDKTQSKIEIWGSGTPLREFLWSEDMADACVHIMENINFDDILAYNKSTSQESFHINIGTGREISIKELALTIQKQIGFEGELYFNTAKPDGTPRKLTDSTRLKNLGWTHKVNLNQGVRMAYEWYLQNQN